MDTEFLDNILYRAEVVLVVLVVLFLVVVGFIALWYAILLWLKIRAREEHALHYILLQVSVPKDNEIKIDAAEQFFSSFASLHKSGWKIKNIEGQVHFAFEIVATAGNIRFYVSVPHKYQDLVEKQIYGSWPGAEVKRVPEYNIFSRNGKVAFKTLTLKKEEFYPIKVYKDLPVDPLSSITATL